MKSILTTLLLFLGLNFSFAQHTAIVKQTSDITSLKSSGKGMITLPEGLTSDVVAEKAKYYTHYFTVQYDEKSSVASFTMVENDDRARSIITRFLAACDVNDVKIEGKLVNRDDFFQLYLKD